MFFLNYSSKKNSVSFSSMAHTLFHMSLLAGASEISAGTYNYSSGGSPYIVSGTKPFPSNVNIYADTTVTLDPSVFVQSSGSSSSTVKLFASTSLLYSGGMLLGSFGSAIDNVGTATVYGGYAKNYGGNGFINRANATAYVTGGKLAGIVGLRNLKDGTAYISGGTLYANSSGNSALFNRGNTTVSGNSTLIEGANGPGVYNNESGVVTVYNGTITGKQDGIRNRAGTVYVAGGTISGNASDRAGVRTYSENTYTGTAFIAGGNIYGGSLGAGVRNGLVVGLTKRTGNTYVAGGIITGGSYTPCATNPSVYGCGLANDQGSLKVFGQGLAWGGNLTNSTITGTLLNGDFINTDTSGKISVYNVAPSIYFSGTSGDWSKIHTWGLKVIPDTFHDVKITGGTHQGAPVFKGGSYVMLSDSRKVNSLTLGNGLSLTIESGARLTATGGDFLSTATSSLTMANGALPTALGDIASASGVLVEGALNIGSNTLELRDANEAELGNSTTLAGGTINAPNGVALDGNNQLSGYGILNTDVTHNSTMAIAATGGGLIFTGNLSGDGDFTGDIIVPGTFSPGNSPAIINMESLVLTGTVDIELGGTTPGTGHDQIVLDELVLLGNLNVSLISPFEPIFGSSFLIFDVSTALVGTFDGLPEGALVGTFGGTDLFITYSGGDGNDIVLLTSTGTVVPEPSSAALLSIALGVGTALRKRKE